MSWVVPYLPSAVGYAGAAIAGDAVSRAGKRGLDEIEYHLDKRRKISRGMPSRGLGRRTVRRSIRKRKRILRRKFKRSRGRRGNGMTTRYKTIASSKVRRAPKNRWNYLCRNVDRAEDANAPVCTTIREASQTLSAAAAQCKTVGFFGLSRLASGVNAQNGMDLAYAYGHCFGIETGHGQDVLRHHDEIYLRSAEFNFAIRETTGAAARIFCWELICIKDHTYMDGSNSQDWDTYISNVPSAHPQASLTGTSAITTTHPSFSPWICNTLGTNWKIFKQHEFYLEASQSIYWTKVVNIKKFRHVYKDLGQTTAGYKGLSRLFVFKILGDLDTTTGLYSAAEAKIHLQTTIKYSSVKRDQRLITIGGTLAPT